MTRVVAEMGGKNAIIVDESADLEEAVRGVIRSAFGFQGQKCSACSRLVLHREVHEPFVEALLEKIQALPAGPPGGSLHLHRTGGQPVRHGKDPRFHREGAGGRNAARRRPAAGAAGIFVAPTVFTGIQPGSTLEQEEIFGPVLAVVEARASRRRCRSPTTPATG